MSFHGQCIDLLSSLSNVMDIPWFALLPAGVLLSIPTYSLLLRRQDIWIPGIVLSHALLYLQRSEGISIPELIFAALFYPVLGLWFLKQLTLRRRLIISPDEFFLLGFLVYAFFSIFVAAFQGYSIVDGLRQFVQFFLPYLFYFPIRNYLTHEGKVDRLLWVFVGVGTIVASVSLIKYRLAATTAEFLYQLWSTRFLGVEALYVSTVVILFSFLSNRKYSGVVVGLCLMINLLALALTFSRMYWFGMVIALGLLLVFSRKDDRRRLIRLTLVGLSAGLVFMAILFPNIILSVLEALWIRLNVIGFKDASLLSRLSESNTIMDHIRHNPIIGYGLGHVYSFYDVVIGSTRTTWFVHNGYLFLILKFGLVGLLLYLSYYLIALASAIVAIRNGQGISHDVLSIAAATSIAMLVVNITSPQFYDRAAMLFLTIAWAIIRTTSHRGRLFGA